VKKGAGKENARETIFYVTLVLRGGPEGTVVEMREEKDSVKERQKEKKKLNS